MALEFPDEYETSEGPLDVAKSAGWESGTLRSGDHSSEKEPLVPDSEVDDEAEVLHHKNPLGYTITQPTEDEIEELDGVGKTATTPV